MYHRLLANHGISARVLPLFGNVPIGDGDALDWLGPRLASAGCHAAHEREAWWLCAMFGTLHPCWPPEPLLGRLRRAAAACGKRVALISAGRLGPGERLWDALAAEYAGDVPMVKLGEQPESRVSAVLNTVDFGIATTPYALLGKSGTAAALLEHGLPVIVNREDGPVPGDHDEMPHAGRLIRLDGMFEVRVREARRGAPGTSRAAVAAALLTELQLAREATPEPGWPVAVGAARQRRTG
jgi:hypothetical protein